MWWYLNVLLRHRYVVVTLPLLLAVLTVALSLSRRRQYVSTTSFVSQEAGPTGTGLSSLVSQFGFLAPTGSLTSPQFYADLLQSKAVMREVVRTVYAVEGSDGFRGTLIQYFSVAEPDSESAAAQAVEFLKGATTVTTDRITGVVRLKVATRYAALSAQVATRYLELLNDYNLRRRQSQARAEREFVEARLAAYQSDLQVAEQALAEFYRRNRRIEDAPQLRAEEGRLLRQVTFHQQLYLTLAQRHEAAKIDEVRDTPVLTILDRPEIFVEPQARGTVRKGIIALVVGVLLAAFIAFGREYIASAGPADADGYGDFLALRREALNDLRGGMLRRLRRRPAAS